MFKKKTGQIRYLMKRLNTILTNILQDNKPSSFYSVRNAEKLQTEQKRCRPTNPSQRLREKEDFDEDDCMKYAVKKRMFLFEKKLDEYDPPRYYVEEDDKTMPASLSYNKLS